MRGVVVLALGDERIELVVAHTGARWPAPAEAPGARFQHVMVVASDIQRAYDQLQSVPPVPIRCGGPQQLPQSSGGARAFKFRDPEGHPLEMVEFPPGVGDRPGHSARARRGAGPARQGCRRARFSKARGVPSWYERGKISAFVTCDWADPGHVRSIRWAAEVRRFAAEAGADSGCADSF